MVPVVMLIICRFVFGVTAFLPLMTSGVAVLVKEQVVHPSKGHNPPILSFIESSKQHILQLWTAVRQPDIFYPTLFIFLWQATPHSDTAMFFFTYAQFSLLYCLVYVFYLFYYFMPPILMS